MESCDNEIPEWTNHCLKGTTCIGNVLELGSAFFLKVDAPDESKNVSAIMKENCSYLTFILLSYPFRFVGVLIAHWNDMKLPQRPGRAPKTLFLVACIVLAEPLSSTLLFPFVYFMVKDFGDYDEVGIGYRAGLISILAILMLLLAQIEI